jgi:hypothetical protein
MKQLYITSFAYPLDSVKTIFYGQKTLDLLCKSQDFCIKKFLGSDWSIIGSGFMFSLPNNFNAVFTVSNIESNDFNIINKYKITYLNEKKSNNNLEIVVSLINNTIDYSTIIEFSLYFENDSDIEIIDFSLIKNILSQICYKINSLFKIYDKEDKNKISLVVNHSFIIKKYYKDAFNFYYNWNNIAKSLKTEKVWKIKSENLKDDDIKYKNFSIIINENIKIHYRVMSIEEEKDKKIEIIYNKTGNSFPALNNYIKFSFFHIAKDICYFLYETHLPINTSSSIFQTSSNYVYYCNKKSKNYFENGLIEKE